jgi:hypothetical protein
MFPHSGCRALWTLWRRKPFKGLSRHPRAAASPLPRAADAGERGRHRRPASSRLLVGRPPSSAPSSRPDLLGPAPSLLGWFCGEVQCCPFGGLPPPSVWGDFWEVSALLRPHGLSPVSNVPSCGAAAPQGGPLVAVPRSASASRDTCPVVSTATTPPSTTGAATHTRQCGVTAPVEWSGGGPPGPARAMPTLL